MREVNCQNCGKVFQTAQRGHHKFCSIECRTDWYNQNRRSKLKDFVCSYCGQTFEAKDKRRLYCSRECAIAASNQRQKERKPHPIKICSICGKPFEWTRNSKRYCSQSCCDKARSRRKGKSALKTLPSRVRAALREDVADRQDNLCWLCGDPIERFDVHHLDGDGYGDAADNSAANLVAMHRECHKLFHQVNLIRRNDTWSLEGDILKYLHLTVKIIKE